MRRESHGRWSDGGAATQVEFEATIKRLAPPWFVLRDAHGGGGVRMQPRCTMAYLHGPMTRGELRRAIAECG